MEPLSEFIADYIWKTIKYNGTMGFCYREDLLAFIIQRAIDDYNSKKEWKPFRPQNEIEKEKK